MATMLQHVQRALNVATPWLSGVAAGFFALWLVVRCHEVKPFAKEWEWFGRLTPAKKFLAFTVVRLFTLWGGSKNRGIPPAGQPDNILPVSSRGESFQLRTLPEEISTNALAITGFAVDSTNRIAYFETCWAPNLFDYTDSCGLFLFASTNLLERQWSPLGMYTMPEDTNACSFLITGNDVISSMRDRFLDTFDGRGFYRFGVDFDTDGDGLADDIEKLWIMTDPLNPDTDGDGLSDGEELSDVDEFVVYFTNPLVADTDGDGISDGVEVNTYGSNPTATDTDADGLPDAQEAMLGTSLNNPDSDGDGLLDGWEVANSFNPLSTPGSGESAVDTDGDGLSNLQEQTAGSNPRNSDSDGDGLSDSAEFLTHHTNPLVVDTDYDGVSDGLEVSLNLNPLEPDTDSDGMNDGWEYQHRNMGFDPAVDNATDGNPDNDIGADPDGDGLTNGQECEWGTNPANADSDGDGVADGTEIGQNSDPTDASDGGQPNTRIAVPFYFGDPSGSHSEKYRLEVMPVSGIGETPASFSWLNENYGECESKTAMLKAGWKYEVRLYHAGTNGSGSGYPDYDYELDCESTSLPSNVVVDDPAWLFGTDYTSDSFAGAGKVATITVYAVTVVTICKPDDPSWAELEESRVVLDDEDLCIKIEIAPQLKSIAQCRQVFGDSLAVKTTGTCPAGASVPIGDDVLLVNSSGKSEIRISKTRQQLISLGLLPSKNEDGVTEMAWLDMGSTDASQSSNLTDSEAFSSLGYQFHGKATVDATKTLESTPPNSVPSESFFKAAGCEIISVEYGYTESSLRQIMNQADYFYYSGHGSFTDGALQSSRNPLVYGFTPSLATGRWGGDLDCVIFAGCSVLNIGDFRSRSFKKWKTKARYWFRKKQSNNGGSPGKLWENIGAKYLLGYCWTAPLDTQGATAVASTFVQNLKNNMSAIDAWRDANSSTSTLNACAIDASSIPHKFWYWDETSGVPVWTNAVKGVQCCFPWQSSY